MGAKITIDSSTLMNKGLEVIEAHELFGVAFDRIDVVVHPQSIVHSMVEFVDGATIAQLSMPDMRLPIGLALGAPARLPTRRSAPSTGPTLGQLTFETPDLDAFPCLRLAFDAGRAGGGAPAVLSGANEVAVGGVPRRPDPVDGDRRRSSPRPSTPAPGTFTRSPTFSKRTGWRARARHRRRRPTGAEPHEGSRWRKPASRSTVGVATRHPAASSSPAMVALAVFVPGSRTPLLIIVGIILMVMLHEFGHYSTAKRAGMKVTEFFLGFGPRLWSFTPRRDRVRREGASPPAATCGSSA